MRFESPLAFLLLIFLPLFLERRQGASLPALRFSSPVPLEQVPRSLISELRSPLLSFLRATGFLLLVIALARPQTGTQFTEIESSGRDIILALDLSGSMQAMDFFLDGKRVDRLTMLKTVAKEFIGKRQGDRMGIVVFGTEAFTQCPLTTDTETLKEFVDMAEIGMCGKATAIGSGLAVALKQIRNIAGNSKVIILITDGKSNAGVLQPEEAAKVAKELNVKVHTVGIGGAGLAPFQMETFFGGSALVNQELEYDEKTLKQVAEITGGKYFFAKDTEKLKEIYNEIDKLEERKEKTLQYVEYEEHFFILAAWGVLLFLLAEALGGTVFLQIP